MADNELDEFGFEPIEDNQDDLSEFGFEPMDIESEPVLDESQTGIPNVGDIEADLASGAAKEGTTTLDKESALLGFGQGASFGLSPVVSGAVGAGTQALKETGLFDTEQEEQAQAAIEAAGIEDTSDKGTLQNLLDAYYQSRDAQKREESKAFEENTGSFVLGNILGGATTLNPSTALAAKVASRGGKLGKAAASLIPQIEKTKGLGMASRAALATREGAKAGALAELGQGESRLLEGDVEGTIDEVSRGAKTGGLVSGLATGALGGLNKIVKNLPGSKSTKTGYELGKKGINLEEDTIKNRVKGFSENLYGHIRKTFSDSGLSKADALDFADEVGIRVNAGESIDDAISKVTKQKALTTESASEKQKLLQVYNELKGIRKGDVKLESSLNRRVNRERLSEGLEPKTLELQKGDVDGMSYAQYADSELEKTYEGVVDKLPIESIDLENATLRDVESLIDEVNRYTGDLQQAPKSTTERSARQLAQQLRDLSNTAVEDSSILSDSNKGLASIFEGLRRGKVKGNVLTKSPNQQATQIDQLRNLIQGSGDSTEINRERFFQYLSKADPKFKQAAGYSEMLNKGLQLAKSSEPAGSLSPKSLVGSYQSAAGKLGNIAGQAKRSVTQSKDKIGKGLLQGYEKIKNMSPEQTQNLISKIEASGEDAYRNFLNPLQKAYTGKDSTKTAILYGLYQQPAFRKMLKDIGEEVGIIEEEDK